MAAAVIGPAPLMIYSKWAVLEKKNRWQVQARRQHDEVETVTRKGEEKAK